MPPKRKRSALNAEVADWVAQLHSDRGTPADAAIDWPIWRRLPDFLEYDIDPPSGSTWGWRFHPDGRIEIVTRGS